MAEGGGDYFSIDAVLAEETAIPCAFQCGAQGIGRALDASSGASHSGLPCACRELLLLVRRMWVDRAIASARQFLAGACAMP